MLFLSPMPRKRRLPKKIFQFTGLTIPQFCEQFLHTHYKAFQYRIRVGRCNPNEIIFISWYLGESVEELFGKPFTELMLGQGDSQVSQKALDLFAQAPEKEKKRLMGLLGYSFTVGVSPLEIVPGASRRKKELELDGEVLPPMLPTFNDMLPDVDIKKRHKAALKANGKTQKKAPILTTTVEDLAPKQPKGDPFDIFDDFRVSR